MLSCCIGTGVKFLITDKKFVQPVAFVARETQTESQVFDVITWVVAFRKPIFTQDDYFVFLFSSIESVLPHTIHKHNIIVHSYGNAECMIEGSNDIFKMLYLHCFVVAAMILLEQTSTHLGNGRKRPSSDTNNWTRHVTHVSHHARSPFFVLHDTSSGEP